MKGWISGSYTVYKSTVSG